MYVPWYVTVRVRNLAQRRELGGRVPVFVALVVCVCVFPFKNDIKPNILEFREVAWKYKTVPRRQR